MEAVLSASLNILHVLRAPIGGLFRHVVDLARGQAARGHRVGVIADSTTSDALAQRALTELAGSLALGVSTCAFPRHIGLADFGGVRHVSQRIAQTQANVVHGHGAKGGAYARLAAAPSTTIRAYTPHGGSLHYDPSSPLGFLYLGLERLLMPRGDLFLFESAYSRDVFHAKVGTPRGIARVVHNGIGEADFIRAEPNADATDVLFIGELRQIKGVDVLIDAIALLHRQGLKVTATIVGSGPDQAALQKAAARHEGGGAVRFLPAMPARRAFGLGRLLVVPSRAESLPYIVLEAAGAGVPLVATRVGGIPEIFGPDSTRLVPPGNAAALAAAIAAFLQEPDSARGFAERLRQRVLDSFSIDRMVDEILASYRQALRTRSSIS